MKTSTTGIRLLQVLWLAATVALVGSSTAISASKPFETPDPAKLEVNLQSVPGLTDKSVTVFGLKINYVEAGSGPTVILIHGLGGSLNNWAPTVGPLSQKYHVIALDQVGFGHSDKPMINYRVGTLVDFFDGFMTVLKIDKATLVGNSLGGWTAAAFALAHPEKVHKLVLVDAAGFSLDKGVDPRTLNRLNASTLEGARQMIGLVFYNKFYSSDAVVSSFFTQKMMAGDGYTIQRFIDSIANNEDVLDNTVTGIKQPTLVIWGKQDLLVPIATGERFHNSIKGSEMVVIDQCGHVPQIEKASEFNAALMKFLAEGTPQSSGK